MSKESCIYFDNNCPYGARPDLYHRSCGSKLCDRFTIDEKEPTIQTIPIDPDAKYLLLVQGLDIDDSIHLIEQLRNWHKSDEKIGVICADKNTEWKFVKVDEQSGE